MDSSSAIGRIPPGFRLAAPQRSGKAKELACASTPPGTGRHDSDFIISSRAKRPCSRLIAPLSDWPPLAAGTGWSVYTKGARYLYNGLAGFQSLNGRTALVRGQFERSPEPHVLCLGALAAFSGSRPNERPLEIGEPSKDRPRRGPGGLAGAGWIECGAEAVAGGPASRLRVQAEARLLATRSCSRLK
jgi:hypothetical protein